MTGYFDNPGATAQALDADGWLHTGDLGSTTLWREGRGILYTGCDQGIGSPYGPA